MTASHAAVKLKSIKKSNESEVEYSPPPGIGFCFAACCLLLSHLADGFYLLIDSGSSKHFIDPKLIRGVEYRMMNYTEIYPPVGSRAAGDNTLYSTTQDVPLV